MTSASINRVSLVMLLLLFCTLSFSQATKGIKLIEKGAYDEAFQALQPDLSNEKYAPLAQFGLGMLYSTAGYSGYDLNQAYEYTLAAEKSFRKLDYKLKKRLNKKINTTLIKNQKKAIAIAAFNKAEEINTLDSWNHFLNTYQKPGYKYQKNAAIARNELAFQKAQAAYNYQAFAALIDNYGSSFSSRSPALYKEVQLNLFNLYIQENSWDSLAVFSSRYPENYLIKNGVSQQLEQISATNDVVALNDFAYTYRNTAFNQRGIDSLAVKLKHHGSYETCRAFLENHPNHPQIDGVWQGLYFNYLRNNSSYSDLEQFERMFPGFPFQTRLENDKSMLRDRMYSQVMERGTIGANKNFIEKFPEYSKIDSVWLNYYNLYKQQNRDIDGLERFGSLNPDFPFPKLLQKDKNSAIDAIATRTLATDDLILHKAFVENYSNHKQTPEVLEKYYGLFKKEAKSWRELEDFKNTYPQFPKKAQINKDIAYFKHNEEQIALDAISGSNDPKDFFDYLDKFPDSRNTRKVEGMLIKVLLMSDDKSAMKNYVERFPNGKNKEVVLKKLYQTIAQDGTKDEILEFIDSFPGIIPTAQLDKDLKNIKIKDYELGLFSPEKTTLFKTYIRQNAPNEKAYSAMRKMLKPLLKAEKFQEAASEMDSLKLFFKDENQKFNKLYTILTTQGQIVEIESISDLVNTKEAMEYAPIISADGKTLLLCRNDNADFKHNENIHISKWKDGKWQQAISIPELSTFQNEAPEALSADGNSMILFVEGKICSSEKQKTGWTKPKPLSNAINKNFWQADARITADGNALLFASGSSVYADDIDIFVSVRDEDGNWTKAHSLGNVINTNKADRAPYLHPDMKTLYFCSKGHVGIGQFDVFVTKRLDDSWTNWSEPVNLGIGINTVNNEWEFKVTTDGSQAYFSKEGGDGDVDIFVADLPEAFKPDEVATISGKLIGIDGEPVSAEIQWEDLETGEIVQITRSDPVTGEFFATLPDIGRFGYSIRHPEFFPLSGNVDISEEVKDFKLEEDMVLATVEEMKTNKVKLELNNLFFETAKYDIKPTSYPELNRLADWMKQYDLSIEILGHTDNVGEDNDNQVLSENRAKAVKNYLVSKGVSPEDITAIGFGEKEPVASNDNAKGRAQNRRVEIRIRD